MLRGEWVSFSSNKDASAVRFDLMDMRFLKIRDRSRDCKSRGRAYIVIDLLHRKVLEDQTEYRPKQGRER